LLRISLLFLFLFSFAFSEVKIYALKAIEKNHTIYLTKPYMIYKNFYIQSQKAVIKNDKTAVFSGNVIIFYKDEVIKSNKVTVKSKNKILITNSFLYDHNLDIWFENKKSIIYNQNLVYLYNTKFSSCCSNKPDWYIKASHGSFNKKTKYIKLYNITLYIHNTPVFYFPFYFNSLDKTRRSGLLRPYIGFSGDEGFLYSQPVYFATSLRNDLELTPTIRTRRGKGIYSTFRFVDSPNSKGEFKAGIFYDKNSYFKQNDLAHKEHFGYEFLYNRNKIFSKDKLYMDIKYANDVSYFYLNPKNYTFDTSYLTNKIITSKINYISNFKSSVLGIYNKYFIDTSLLSNKNTIQLIPQINYHIFERKNKSILSSLDYNFYNYFNQNHKKYFVNTFLLPVGRDFKTKNRFVNLKISEVLQGAYGNFYNSSLPPSYFITGFTQFKLYTSLIKTGSFTHVISPELIYNVKNYSKTKITSNILEDTSMKNNIAFNLFQIFQKNNFYLDHTLHQIYYVQTRTAQPIENIVNINYNNFSFSDNNKYNWSLRKISYNAASFNYKFNTYNLKLTHIYQYNPEIKTIDTRVEKKIDQYKNVYFEYNYDMINHYPKFWIFGVNLNKKCWQYDISLKKTITPVLKNNGISYKNNFILNLSINFYPIGGVKQTLLLK